MDRMMITRDPKVKRLLKKIADSKDLEETKKLAKVVVEMLATIIMDLEDDLHDAENKS